MRLLLAALLAIAAPAGAQPAGEAIAAVAGTLGSRGHVLVADDKDVIWGTPAPPHSSGIFRGVFRRMYFAPPSQSPWPWASVTKQVVAIMVLQQVERGRLALDAPASRYLPQLAGGPPAPTLRQLLQHRSGLFNPEDAPKDADGIANWYTTGPTGLAPCLGGRSAPTTAWRYNNCDYVVLGAILERVSGRSVDRLFEEQIARPLDLRRTRFARTDADLRLPGAPVPARRPDAPASVDRDAQVLKRYGAAGGLIGSAEDLLALDRALADGRLLSAAARAELWRADPTLGYMALGQWVFTAPLKGCAQPVRIVERRGGIGRFQVRNIILPDLKRFVIVFTSDGEFDFGEIWQGRGFSHDLLSAAACP